MTDRFWDKVDKSGDCWQWTAATDPRGYGRYALAGRVVLAHRHAFTETRGPIASGLTLDHLCRNPGCVNPVHLEPVTNVENVRRGVSWQAAKTHCPQGHPYNEANTHRYQGRRYCRPCHATLTLAAYHARKAAAA